MTHDKLVRKARAWLRKEMRCSLVLTEFVSAAFETPDAVGWLSSGISHLVECKTSVADFRRDREKPSRRKGMPRIGLYRWYMTPSGLLRGIAMPPNWGLVEVLESGFCFVAVVPPPVTAGNRQPEIAMLVSAVRKARRAGR